MAISQLAAVQELTRYAWKALDMLGDPGKQWTLGLLKKVETDHDPLTGRNRKAYWSYSDYEQSVGGPFSESSPALGSANDENAVELQMTPVDMHRTVGLSWQRFDQLKRMGSKQRALSFAKLMQKQLDMERFKQVKMFEGGRGDGVVARAHAAGAGTTTFTCAAQVPILCQRGDQVTAYKADAGDANGERNKGQADTGTLYLSGTSRRVKAIKFEGATAQITLNSAASWSDDAILVWSQGATITSPYGLPNHLDNVDDSTFKWDSEDSTSCDHLDVYFGGTRSSNSDLNCQTYNAGTAELDLPLFSTGVALCIDGNQGDPSVANELVVFMHPKMWRRFVKNSQGAVRLTTGKMFLPGYSSGKATVPVITGNGVNEMPIRVTHSIPDGFVAYVHYKRLRKILTTPTWIEGTDGVWHLLPQASVAGHQAQFHAYLVYTMQTGCFLPRSSAVVYSIDTSVTV